MERKCVLCILLENLWLEVSFIRKPNKEKEKTHSVDLKKGFLRFCWQCLISRLFRISN